MMLSTKVQATSIATIDALYINFSQIFLIQINRQLFFYFLKV